MLPGDTEQQSENIVDGVATPRPPSEDQPELEPSRVATPNVTTPVETLPCGTSPRADHDFRRSWVARREIARVRAGHYLRIHLMPPCGTFGALAWMGRGTRIEERPEGGGSRAKEVDANLLPCGACAVAAAAAERGRRARPHARDVCHALDPGRLALCVGAWARLSMGDGRRLGV